MRAICAVSVCVVLSMLSAVAADGYPAPMQGERVELRHTSYSSGEIPKTSRCGGCGTAAGMLAREAGTCNLNAEDGGSLGVQAGHYFLSRWYDLIDIVDFSVGAGPGFMVTAHVTKFAQAGGGWSDAYRVGFRGRSAGVWREKRKEVGVSLLYYQKVERECITGWVESFRSDKMDLDTAAVYANNNDRSFLGIGATVQAGILVDINVRPMQAADFVLGWFTIDVLEDDHGKPRRNKDL